MHMIGNIELTETEFALLERLVDFAELNGSDDVTELVVSPMLARADFDEFSCQSIRSDLLWALKSFLEYGFIYGDEEVVLNPSAISTGAAVFVLTPFAHFAIEDARQAEKREEEALRRSNRHDLFIALVGAIVGGVLGLFSGAFGSWLVNIMMHSQ